MACAAVFPELAVVGIVFLVAAVASLRCGFKVCNAAGPRMAAPTIHLGMFTGKLECNIAMVEVMAVAIDAIMAGQAGVPIRLEMGLHEICFDLLVAVRTDGLVETGIAIEMTGAASESCTIRLMWMGS